MASPGRPQRGEVWLVGFEPSLGGEVSKTRLAVVLSNDVANVVLNRVQSVPISSSVQTLYPAEACVALNGRRRKAMADQIIAASILHLRRRKGRLSPTEMDAVARVVRLQLDL